MPPPDSAAHRERQARALRSRLRPAHPPKHPSRPPKPEATPAPDPLFPPPDTGPAPAEAVAAPAPPKKRHPVLALLLAVLLLAGLLLVLNLARSLQATVTRTQQKESEAVMELRYLVPGQDEIVDRVFYGDTAVLHAPVTSDGLTFLGWEDEAGLLETREAFPVYADRVFRGRYALRFETDRHLPYLSTDPDGILHVEDPVSRREFVCILHILLNTDRKGQGTFLDVSPDDSCHDAAALLKDLGVLDGPLLHPDADLARGEMLRMLCAFFPPADGKAVFQDMTEDDPLYPCYCTAVANGWISDGILVKAAPAASVCRGELARVLNRVLGRETAHHRDRSEVGTILDVPPTSQWFDDAAEAVIPHDYRRDRKTGDEIWTSSEPLPLHEPGYFFSGVRLHYIDENYCPAVNGRFQGLDFNRCGEVTTGDEDLDRSLRDVLETLIDPDTMTREEMLRAVYDYVVHNFDYAYGGMYDRGAQGWEIREARHMLLSGSGNCYNFAALFCELARLVGYDARCYAGFAYGEQYELAGNEGGRVIAPQGYTPHGWVEISMDGVDYIFDTEYEYRSSGLRDMYMADTWVRKQYGYMK